MEEVEKAYVGMTEEGENSDIQMRQRIYREGVCINCGTYEFVRAYGLNTDICCRTAKRECIFPTRNAEWGWSEGSDDDRVTETSEVVGPGLEETADRQTTGTFAPPAGANRARRRPEPTDDGDAKSASSSDASGPIEAEDVTDSVMSPQVQKKLAFYVNKNITNVMNNRRSPEITSADTQHASACCMCGLQVLTNDCAIACSAPTCWHLMCGAWCSPGSWEHGALCRCCLRYQAPPDQEMPPLPSTDHWSTDEELQQLVRKNQEDHKEGETPGRASENSPTEEEQSHPKCMQCGHAVTHSLTGCRECTVALHWQCATAGGLCPECHEDQKGGPEKQPESAGKAATTEEGPHQGKDPPDSEAEDRWSQMSDTRHHAAVQEAWQNATPMPSGTKLTPNKAQGSTDQRHRSAVVAVG